MSDSLKLEKIESKGYGVVYKLPMQDKDLDVVAKAFYAYICSYAGAGDTAFPGMDKICSDLGVSRQRLERHRKILVDKGYITINKVKENGRFARNEYKINKSIPLLQNTTTEKPTTENVTSQNVTINNNSINNNSINNNKDNKDIKDIVPQKQDNIDYEGLVNYLNFKTNKNYKHSTKKTRDLIKARLNEGFTLQDFKTVIDKKCDEWLNDGYWNTFLRPETLFGNKFEGYLNQADIRGNQQGKKLDPWEAQLHEHYGSEQNTHDNHIGIPFDDKKLF